MPSHVMVSLSSQREAGIGVNATGAVLGLVIGGVHLVWALLVAAGVAQPVIDFIFRLHFIRPVYVVEAFDPLRAVVLVLLSGASGYVIGAAFAFLWNRVHR